MASIAVLVACNGDPDPTPSGTQEFELKPISCAGPVLTPGIGRPLLAFVGFRPGLSEPDIFVAEPDGAEARLLFTPPELPVRSMAWSPDGSTLAVAAGGTVSVVRSDGSLVRTVVERDTAVPSVTWSPEGTVLAFASGAEGDRADVQRFTLSLVGADGSDLRALTDLPIDGEGVTWSPDGRWVAFAAYRGTRLDLHAMRVDGGRPRRLTQAAQFATAPDWSPDCRQIAYVSGDIGGSDLRVLQLDGSGDAIAVDTPVTTPASNARSPVWSPDGRMIAYYVELPTPEALPDPEAFVVRPDGSGGAQLTTRDDGINQGLTWSSDGRWVVVAGLGAPPPGRPDRPGGTGWGLVAVAADGTTRHALIDPASGIEDPQHPVMATSV
jgi:Tol biopolymer transport system component